MKLVLHRFAILLVAIFLHSPNIDAAKVDKGEIAGAKFMVAAPEQWQGRLVIIAHGYR
ncbi:MAG: alpha/beta hydrolase, partial [Verrucomicrobiaceae bacterium]